MLGLKLIHVSKSDTGVRLSADIMLISYGHKFSHVHFIVHKIVSIRILEHIIRNIAAQISVAPSTNMD